MTEHAGRGDSGYGANRVLEIRQQLGKTSIKKYEAMDTAKCKDNRIRGLDAVLWRKPDWTGGPGGWCRCRIFRGTILKTLD